MFFEQHLQFEKWLDAVFRWDAAPLGERRRGRFDCGAAFGFFSEGNFSKRRVSCRVDQLLPFRCGGLNPLAVNEVRDADVGNRGGAHARYLSESRRTKNKQTLHISSRVYRKSQKAPIKDCLQSKIEIIMKQSVDSEIGTELAQRFFPKHQFLADGPEGKRSL